MHYIKIFNTKTIHHRLQNGTILKFVIMFPHNEFCMQKVASVIFIRFFNILGHTKLMFRITDFSGHFLGGEGGKK